MRWVASRYSSTATRGATSALRLPASAATRAPSDRLTEVRSASATCLSACTTERPCRHESQHFSRAGTSHRVGPSTGKPLCLASSSEAATLVPVLKLVQSQLSTLSLLSRGPLLHKYHLLPNWSSCCAI